METKHTPGPWLVFTNPIGVGVCVDASDVAHCSGFDSKRSRGEEEANARLIAAAPDMLAALKEFLRHQANEVPNLDRAETAALSAVAKAEGRS